MWKEVYYKELDRNYEGKGKRILPYSVYSISEAVYMSCKNRKTYTVEEFVKL